MTNSQSEVWVMLLMIRKVDYIDKRNLVQHNTLFSTSLSRVVPIFWFSSSFDLSFSFFFAGSLTILHTSMKHGQLWLSINEYRSSTEHPINNNKTTITFNLCLNNYFLLPLVHWHCWLGGRPCILSPVKFVCPLILQCFDAVCWVRGRASGHKNSLQHPLL